MTVTPLVPVIADVAQGVNDARQFANPKTFVYLGNALVTLYLAAGLILVGVVLIFHKQIFGVVKTAASVAPAGKVAKLAAVAT